MNIRAWIGWGLTILLAIIISIIWGLIPVLFEIEFSDLLCIGVGLIVGVGCLFFRGWLYEKYDL